MITADNMNDKLPKPLALTTGLIGLDDVMHGIQAGDNIVWQIQKIEDYQAIVLPYAEAARKEGSHLVYFRFDTSNPPLLPDDFGAETITLDPAVGFEVFVEQVHAVIERAGRRTMYVLDCLSALAETWQADQLIGNFFMLTCPRLYDLETVTYFAVYRNRHTLYAMQAIHNTTQWMLDVFHSEGRLYIRPVKVQHRSREKINNMFVWEGAHVLPVSDSATVSEILSNSDWQGLQADQRIGYWRRLYSKARSLLAADRPDMKAVNGMFHRMADMMLSDESRLLEMARKYLDIGDLLSIRDRQIGIGRIGGKAVGMLLSRAIIRKEDPELFTRLETHDSFYVGTEVFHTFLVINHLWWDRKKQKDPENFLQGTEKMREKILNGEFPDYYLEQFRGVLDYFGEWPFIVRSSSLLEDAYGNSFAGKYESVFCVNRGTRENRLEELLNAVRKVYASAVSEEALQYRHRRGLLDRDEQMALLIMRVSGGDRGRYFFPMAAGVGLSFNPYPWDSRIDQEAGVVRLVFGLGTRAVNRADDDYTRLVALNAPDLRPETTTDSIIDTSQQHIDTLDLETNSMSSNHLLDILPSVSNIPLDMFISKISSDEGHELSALTFDGLIKNTSFTADLRRMLALLEKIYQHPVEIEFALNFLRDGTYRIHLLQCRTLQVRRGEALPLPETWPVPAKDIITSSGAVIGLSRDIRIDVAVLVDPDIFPKLPIQSRYEVARTIGRINRYCAGKGYKTILMGPGRWGTHDPAMGVPVNFAEINRTSALCEIVAMHKQLMPDVSLGTHFLSELVEMDILYFALFPGRPNTSLDLDILRNAQNRLTEWIPDSGSCSNSIRVVVTQDISPEGTTCHLLADVAHQKTSLCLIREA